MSTSSKNTVMSVKASYRRWDFKINKFCILHNSCYTECVNNYQHSHISVVNCHPWTKIGDKTVMTAMRNNCSCSASCEHTLMDRVPLTTITTEFLWWSRVTANGARKTFNLKRMQCIDVTGSYTNTQLYHSPHCHWCSTRYRAHQHRTGTSWLPLHTCRYSPPQTPHFWHADYNTYSYIEGCNE